MKVLLIDQCFYLIEIPLSIFHIPELALLSIVRAPITYDDILEYNLPSIIDVNDTDAANLWMEENFDFFDSDTTEYWLSFSTICDEIGSVSMAPTFESFLSIHCPYPFNVTSFTEFGSLCMPWQVPSVFALKISENFENLHNVFICPT